MNVAAAAPEAVPDDSSHAEDPFAKANREAREADFVKALENATWAYTDCLLAEADRFFGPDFNNCLTARNALHALYPIDTAEDILECVETAVLEDALNRDAVCPFGSYMQTPDMSNTERWR